MSEHILQGIREGNHRAFELFYRMEFLNLVHFVSAYLRDEDLARDISQEALLSLWENRNILAPGRNIRAFVFTIARNKALNELRSRKRTVAVSEAMNLLEDSSVDEYINALDTLALVRKEWDTIPQKEKKMLLQRQEGLKNREIATREGVSEKTVEYRLKSVRARFKKIFGENDIGV